MMTVFMGIFVLIMIFCNVYFSRFLKKEGKDERGQMILGKAGQVVTFFNSVSFIIIMILNQRFHFSNQQVGS